MILASNHIIEQITYINLDTDLDTAECEQQETEHRPSNEHEYDGCEYLGIGEF